MIKIISFDIQGTITNSSYSDEFWLELLPLLYSKKYEIELNKAKKKLKQLFNEYGKYDYRYYSVKYWEKELNFKFQEVINDINTKLEIEDKIIDLAYNYDIILITTTTKEFIDLELGKYKYLFKKIYSSLDNFDIAGKTKEVYELVANDLNIKTSEIFHIGDNVEMDIINAASAGCEYYYFDKNKNIHKIISEILEKIGRL